MYVENVVIKMNKKIMEDFPFLKNEIIYLDNASTTQKPKQVIEDIKNFYERGCANVHRGVYKISEDATRLYTLAHEKTAEFINAKSWREIIFTKNTTESINLISKSLKLKKGDEIILTEMEHHSNMVPWMMLEGVRIKYIPVNNNGELEINAIEKLITKNTKVISCPHISNFLGTINPVNKIGKIAKKNNIIFVVDAAQSVPHKKVDVQKMNCDFLVFSSHKMCGPTGIGVLYGKRELLEKMDVFLGGGDMIESVDFEKFESCEIPWKFEAGTPNIAGSVGFSAAINYLKNVGLNNIWKHEQNLVKYALQKMKKMKGVEIYGTKNHKKRCGIISFNIKGIDSESVAGIMDSNNICIRSGHHCAMPMHQKLGIDSSARISFYFYNTKKEIDIFIKKLEEIVDGLK